MSKMTPEQVICAAWPQAARNWAPSKHGSRYRVPVRGPIQYGPYNTDAVAYQPSEYVEFRRDEFGSFIGSFKGEEVQVQ